MLIVALFLLLTVSHASETTGGTTAADFRRNGDTAILKANFQDALMYYGQAIKAEPEGSVNWYKRASINVRLKKFSEALPDLDKSISLDSAFKKGFESRAKTNLQLGHCAQAVADYERVQELDPKPNKKVVKELPRAKTCAKLIQEAESYMASGRYEQAKESITQALDIAQHSDKLHVDRVACQFALHNYQDMLVDTRLILQRNPQDLDTLLMRGLAYYYTADYETALNHYKEGLRLAPEHNGLKKQYRHIRSLIKKMTAADDAMRKRKYSEALKLLDESIELDPEHELLMIEQRLKKCKAFTESDKGKEAIVECDVVIEAEPNNIDAYLQRAEAKIIAEQFDAAIADCNKALEIDAHHQRAKEMLRKSELELKKSERKDYYKILGISKRASGAEIKKSYRKLALKYHPDRHQGDEAKAEAELQFKEVVEAYEIISDDEKRGKYDRGEDIEVNMGGGRQHHHSHGFPFGGGNFNFKFN